MFSNRHYPIHARQKGAETFDFLRNREFRSVCSDGFCSSLAVRSFLQIEVTTFNLSEEHGVPARIGADATAGAA